MSIKRLSIRFNLEEEADRNAWNYLQNVSGSKNQRVIDAINVSSNFEETINRTVRTSIKECFKNVSVFVGDESKSEISDDEIELMDNIEAFLGE